MSSVPALGLEQSYAHIREDACAVATVRDAVQVTGPDARSWLQGQLSQDLETLAVGQSAESLVLSPQGKVDVYCRVTMLADDVVLLDTETAYGEVLSERLRRFRLRVKVELESGTLRCLKVRGPASERLLPSYGIGPRASGAGATATALSGGWAAAVKVTWPGYEGFDLLASTDAPEWVAPFVLLGDAAAFEAARIEAGVPAMGRELTDKTIPQEAGNLVEHAVSFTKGCYTGQELVARLDSRGGNVARRLRGVVLEAMPDLLHDATLVSGERELGRLTSVAWSPGFGSPVALCYARRDVVPPTLATVMPGGASGEIRELPLSIR